VPLQPREHLDEPVGEARDGVARVPLEDPEVDDEVDGLLVRPVVRAAVDPRLDDGEVGREWAGRVGRSAANGVLLGWATRVGTQGRMRGYAAGQVSARRAGARVGAARSFALATATSMSG
jgi:hypothetical protein